MGPERTTGLERLLTSLGLWGALRIGSALPIPLAASILLCLLLVPSVSQLVPVANSSVVFFFASCAGVLLGLISYYGAAFWDRALFDAWYGAQGSWSGSSSPVFGLLPSGVQLAEARTELLDSLDRKPDSLAALNDEAVKIARRQAERWAKIEHLLILANAARGLLWPCAFVACIGVITAAASAFLGSHEAARILSIGLASAALFGICLVPYCRLRVAYLIRLYQDVAGHAPRKKQPYLHRSEPGTQQPGRPATTHRRD